jgi:4-hydroxybenzoyl-CoA reductase subunit beta
MYRFPFEVIHPATVAEAAEFLRAHSGEVQVLAGGSDLMASLNQRLLSPRYLVDLQGLPGMSGIKEDRKLGLRIGAMTTLRCIERSPLVRRLCPILAKAAGKVGSVQIRNLGTIGGNLCLDTRCWYYNQSPFWRASKPPCVKAGGEECYVVQHGEGCYALHASDTVPALIALDAQVSVESSQGQSVRPVESLFTGDGESPLALQAGDLIVEVIVPTASLSRQGVYIKHSPKSTIAFPLVGLAVTLELDSPGRNCKSARIVIGGVASAPLRAPEAEELLKGLTVDDRESIAAAAQAAAREVKIYSDVHNPAGYKRKIIQIVAEQAIEDAFQQTNLPLEES